MSKQVQVLFVCMGNICRSPTAEAIFNRLVNEADLAEVVLIDSAGTHGYHVGEAPDPRSSAKGEERGVQMTHLRARQVSLEDFKEYDYIVAMDYGNLHHLQSLCPKEHDYKLSLLMHHANQSAHEEVPDPYYGEDGFDLVFDLVEEGAQGLLAKIIQELKSS